MKAAFKWSKAISDRQYTIFRWWASPQYKDKDGIIADGAIRSGKTVAMALSFVLWAMENFNNQNFAMAGKTVGSLRRNVVNLLKIQINQRKGWKAVERRADNLLIITRGDRVNNFYLFGGKDESSQDLIQGITLAGAFFDEVALMPESFVNQATARCSVDGSKWWFNCNPSNPHHWFKVNWIDKAIEKNLLYLHFTMDDNASLSEAIKARYARQYVGVFFKRYILGLWVAAEGLVYDMFSRDKHVTDKIPECEDIVYISSDFGIQNPNVWLLIKQIRGSNKWIISRESVYSGRESNRQKTVQELADDLEKMLDGAKPKEIIIDPSAAAMIAELRKRHYIVHKADNDVIDGISDVQTMLADGRLLVSADCKNTIKEFEVYSWDSKAADNGEDKPIKQNDHCMDALRYFVRTKKLVKRDRAQESGGVYML
jgi:PBSX family phage terminase large subunit